MRPWLDKTILRTDGVWFDASELDVAVEDLRRPPNARTGHYRCLHRATLTDRASMDYLSVCVQTCSQHAAPASAAQNLGRDPYDTLATAKLAR